MRILIYKQTHIGDPSKVGRWGLKDSDCMGRVRGLEYEAVIGVGGSSPWPRREGISGKVTWVGRVHSKRSRLGMRGPIVSFKPFVRFEAQGPLVSVLSPLLARRLYERRARYFIAQSGPEHAEASYMLSLLLSQKGPPNRRLKPTCLPPLRCGKPAA